MCDYVKPLIDKHFANSLHNIISIISLACSNPRLFALKWHSFTSPLSLLVLHSIVQINGILVRPKGIVGHALLQGDGSLGGGVVNMGMSNRSLSSKSVWG